MTIKRFSTIRRQYGVLGIHEEEMHECPIVQFERWFLEHLGVEKNEPNAMVLSTVDEQGFPDSRVVLLKALEDNAFVFYTNYLSTKGIQMSLNAHVALNFYWSQECRQVRVRGQVQRVSKEQSDSYFRSRPIGSQLSSIASPQSTEVHNRAELEHKLNELNAQHKDDKEIVRPEHWGGYAVIPEEFEYWQGRENRLNDRIHYYLKQGKWHRRRLAP